MFFYYKLKLYILEDKEVAGKRARASGRGQAGVGKQAQKIFLELLVNGVMDFR